MTGFNTTTRSRTAATAPPLLSALLATLLACPGPKPDATTDAGSTSDAAFRDDAGSMGDAATPDLLMVDTAATDVEVGADAPVPDSALADRATVDGRSPDRGSDIDAAVDPRPILERPPRLEYTCTEQRGVTPFEAGMWWGKEAVVSPGGLFLARGEGGYGAVDLLFSEVSLDGTLGTAVPVSASETVHSWHPSLVATADGFALVWAEIDGDGASQAIFFATLDGSGAVSQGPTEVAGTRDQEARRPQLLATTSGYALLWINRDSSGGELRFVLLDPTGAPTAAAVGVAQALNVDTPTFIATHTGFAAAWSGYGAEGWQVNLALLDGSGQRLGAPTRLSTAGLGAMGPSLLLYDDEILAAWDESYIDSMAGEGHGEVRVARLDLSGELLGDPQLLHAIEMHQQSVTPKLLEIGEEVALVWSHGSIIYICAGCMPDNVIQMVVLDRRDLVPISEVVELANPEDWGGLLDPEIAMVDLDLLMLFEVTYHVHSVPASAAVRCEPVN